MMNRLRPTALIVLACLGGVQASAQSTLDLKSVIQPGGAYVGLVDGQSILKSQFAIFRDGWVRLNQWSPGPTSGTLFTGNLDMWPGNFHVKTTYRNASGGTEFNVTATPSRNTTSNSDHIVFYFDRQFWAGATMVGNGNTVPFNADVTQGFARTITTPKIVVTRPDGFSVTIETSNPVTVTAQDSRGGHLGYEVRFDERSGFWAANTSRTYSYKVSYSKGIPTFPDVWQTIEPGTEWVPLPAVTGVAENSALDWSDPAVQPAGSKGWLRVNSAGKFVFENDPNRPVKFYGANLAHYACFPNHEEAEWLSENLARMGYNTVRLHHIDYILNEGQPNSTALNPHRLDQLNYLMARLKAKGIYVKIDLHSLRALKTNEVISGESNFNEYKALLVANQGVRENWLQYSSNLLNTTNPYTGLKWKDDPALAWIAIDNENTPFWFDNVRPHIKAHLDAVSSNGWWDPYAKPAEAMSLVSSAASWMNTQLKNIGVKSLLTNINAGFNKALNRHRRELEFVDNHWYFSHPNWGMPQVQKPGSPMRDMVEYGWFAVTRIKGKAFTVSEFDAVAPNPFRSEFGLLMAAMGSVQQWDGMWRFQWADNMGRATQLGPINLFSVAVDPVAMAAERALVSLYLRGDLTVNDSPVVVNVPDSAANGDELRDLPLLQQSVLAKPIVVSHNEGNPNPAPVVKDGISSTADNQVKADLNELTLRIATTRTSGFIASPGKTVQAGALTATVNKSRASLWVSSIDKRPISSSKRMLLVHLTDVQNTGTVFGGEEKNVLHNWGGLPHLAKDGSVTVTLQMMSPNTARVYRLDLSGRRKALVPTIVSGNTLKFDATVKAPDGTATLYYEIVK